MVERALVMQIPKPKCKLEFQLNFTFAIHNCSTYLTTQFSVIINAFFHLELFFLHFGLLRTSLCTQPTIFTICRPFFQNFHPKIYKTVIFRSFGESTAMLHIFAYYILFTDVFKSGFVAIRIHSHLSLTTKYGLIRNVLVRVGGVRMAGRIKMTRNLYC